MSLEDVTRWNSLEACRRPDQGRRVTTHVPP